MRPLGPPPRPPTSGAGSSDYPLGSRSTTAVLLTGPEEYPEKSSDGVGAFRTVCEYSHMNTDDPLVHPNRPGAAHLHAYFGNTSTNAYTTPESLHQGATTCRGGAINRSAYWVPAVIDTRTGRPIRPSTGIFYYKSGYGKVPASEIRAFPRGLRMLAGDPTSSTRQAVADWVCEGAYSGEHGEIPRDCPPGKHVNMRVEFPQCWDGRNLDSADHRSHMAYPVNNACPASHPIALPTITFNVHYEVPPQGTASWRLSSDHYDASLPGGRSSHADWMEGWDPAVVQTFVSRCINEAFDCNAHMLGDGRVMLDP